VHKLIGGKIVQDTVATEELGGQGSDYQLTRRVEKWRLESFFRSCKNGSAASELCPRECSTENVP